MNPIAFDPILYAMLAVGSAGLSLLAWAIEPYHRFSPAAQIASRALVVGIFVVNAVAVALGVPLFTGVAAFATGVTAHYLYRRLM